MEKIRDVYEKMNRYFQENIPYFFMINFKGTEGIIVPLNEIGQSDYTFSTPNYTSQKKTISNKSLQWTINVEPFDLYKIKFDKVQKQILQGNSYLLNLCCHTPIYCNYSLDELFDAGIAPYKLLYKDQFVHFSPESFIKIENNKIHTFPMKGTIDAEIPNAEEILLSDKKEMTEHNIITDLMRNDLSIVADDVYVKRFRYIEKIQTNTKPVLQTSSHIVGNLKEEYKSNPGDIFSKLLPAGSISGAPKDKTIKIIEDTEDFERQFYTGVWGIYDGKDLDSCVIIRMVEKEGNKLYFNSGGGITALSEVEKEYEEIRQKIYVPIY